MRSDSHVPAHTNVPSHQPQVIVVREAPRYHDHDNDAYWYQRGRESAARDARINTPVSPATYGGTISADTPVAPAPRASQVVQPAAPVRTNSEESSGAGSVILYTLIILLVLGALAYFAMQVLNTDPTRKAKAARRKSNYTL